MGTGGGDVGEISTETDSPRRVCPGPRRYAMAKESLEFPTPSGGRFSSRCHRPPSGGARTPEARESWRPENLLWCLSRAIHGVRQSMAAACASRDPRYGTTDAADMAGVSTGPLLI